MPEYTGTVVATSEYGIKVVEGGGWLNWSTLDYRGTPFDAVKKGDKVRFEYAEVEKDGQKKTYISVIENLSRPPGGSPFPPDDQMPPESGNFGPDTTTLPGAPRGPSAGESDADRQTSIVRQTCIKAASVSLQHGMGTPQEKAGGILYLAGELEKWVLRE